MTGAWVQRGVKRALDLFGAASGLLVLSPLLLVLAVAIKLDSRGSVFFADERVGRDEKRLRMWKFRSMVDGASSGPLGRKMFVRDLRITRVGRLMRRLSLDELPQLVNVLRGEMSLVGPRPMLPEHLPHLSPAQRRRFTTPPGLTGWAQINGRNSITWEERIRLDLDYLDRWSVGFDLRILAATVGIVLRGSALYSDHQQRDAL